MYGFWLGGRLWRWIVGFLLRKHQNHETTPRIYSTKSYGCQLAQVQWSTAQPVGLYYTRYMRVFVWIHAQFARLHVFGCKRSGSNVVLQCTHACEPTCAIRTSSLWRFQFYHVAKWCIWNGFQWLQALILCTIHVQRTCIVCFYGIRITLLKRAHQVSAHNVVLWFVECVANTDEMRCRYWGECIRFVTAAWIVTLTWLRISNKSSKQGLWCFNAQRLMFRCHIAALEFKCRLNTQLFARYFAGFSCHHQTLSMSSSSECTSLYKVIWSDYTRHLKMTIVVIGLMIYDAYFITKSNYVIV